VDPRHYGASIPLRSRDAARAYLLNGAYVSDEAVLGPSLRQTATLGGDMMIETITRPTQPSTRPWTLAAVVLGTPLTILMSPWAVVALIFTAIAGRLFLARPRRQQVGMRLQAISVGLLLPVVAYWLLALAIALLR
jgi:hypothetical protein